VISLILPYWERQSATDAALSQMAFHYRKLDLEVIIVDDGSPKPFSAGCAMPFTVKVLRLPEKSIPLNPCGSGGIQRGLHRAIEPGDHPQKADFGGHA
jgi:hypothetical protein